MLSNEIFLCGSGEVEIGEGRGYFIDKAKQNWRFSFIVNFLDLLYLNPWKFLETTFQMIFKLDHFGTRINLSVDIIQQ